MRQVNKKKALLATSLATAGMAGILLVGGVAFAQTTNAPNNLAQAIASKFNLNKDDVQKVIDTQHQERMTSHLDELVKNGKITEDQKSKIIAKQIEMKPKMEAARELTNDAERKKAMDALKSEMQKWEKDNNIPTNLIGLGGHRGGPGRMMMERGEQGGGHR